MCIGIPMKLTSIDGGLGTVEEGGVRQTISLALLEEAREGDYVIVHAGYAISLLDPEDAQETLDLLRQLEVAVSEEAPG